MNILMISGDKEIADEQSQSHGRMRVYAGVCAQLHIIVLTDEPASLRIYGNLFVYTASASGKMMQRVHAYRTARKIAARRNIDCVTAQSPDDLGIIAWRVSKLRGIPLQLQVHTDILSPWYRRAGTVPWIKYCLARFLLPRAQCIRVVSKRIKESLMRELYISDSVIIVLPIFTDIRKFDLHDRVDARGGDRLDFSCKIISVGRFLDREKNFSMLIKAMANVVKKCPFVLLILIGDGPDRQRYEDLIKVYDLKDHVIIKPWRSDLDSLYASFDLFVLPSYIEGWGRAVIEAMASGLAVIMTDVGAAGEIVHDGVNGRVIPVGDFMALSEALTELCEQPEKRRALAQAGKETVMRLHPRTQEEYLAEWKKSFECCIYRDI